MREWKLRVDRMNEVIIPWWEWERERERGYPCMDFSLTEDLLFLSPSLTWCTFRKVSHSFIHIYSGIHCNEREWMRRLSEEMDNERVSSKKTFSLNLLRRFFNPSLHADFSLSLLDEFIQENFISPSSSSLSFLSWLTVGKYFRAMTRLLIIVELLLQLIDSAVFILSCMIFPPSPSNFHLHEAYHNEMKMRVTIMRCRIPSTIPWRWRGEDAINSNRKDQDDDIWREGLEFRVMSWVNMI